MSATPMPTDEQPLRIIELRVENFKRLRAIRIRPDGSTVIISGRNSQGKSSTLDAIETALGGGRSMPEEPIRKGARKARSFLDLGELTVEKTITPRGVELVVKAKGNPVPMKSPQAILDKLCAKISFDPLEFARMDAPKQDALLKTMLGLDFSDIEGKRKRLYDERTEVNRELTRVDALLDRAPYHPAAPKKLVDVAALSAKLKAYDDAVAARHGARQPLEKLRAQLEAKRDGVVELERQLQAAREAIVRLEGEVDALERKLPPEPESPDATRAELSTAEQTNAKVRENEEHDKLERAAQMKAEESAECKARIEALDQEKAERLAAAKFPIDGLGFDESGVTYLGVPLAQSGQAERVRVSLAIGAALNPRLKVLLVREGAWLDTEAMAMLADFAETNDFQVWIERVEDKTPGAIIIEDGSVLEPEEADAPAAAVGT